MYSRKNNNARLWELLVLIRAHWLYCWVCWRVCTMLLQSQMHHKVFTVYITVLCWAIVPKWRWASAKYLLETSHRVFSWWLVHRGVSGKKERKCLSGVATTANVVVLRQNGTHLLCYIQPPPTPPQKKGTICEVVLHKPEHVYVSAAYLGRRKRQLPVYPTRRFLRRSKHLFVVEMRETSGSEESFTNFTATLRLRYQTFDIFRSVIS